VRTFNVSTDVFAKIWAMREEGEETEDQILRRILGIQAEPPRPVSKAARRSGFRDIRHGVHFPEGFEIFRVYKGAEYRARAHDGMWVLLNDGGFYETLNSLSQAVIDGNENAWMNWYFMGGDGERRRIAKLRDEAKVARRTADKIVPRAGFGPVLGALAGFVHTATNVPPAQGIAPRPAPREPAPKPGKKT